MWYSSSLFAPVDSELMVEDGDTDAEAEADSTMDTKRKTRDSSYSSFQNSFDSLPAPSALSQLTKNQREPFHPDFPSEIGFPSLTLGWIDILVHGPILNESSWTMFLTHPC